MKPVTKKKAATKKTTKKATKKKTVKTKPAKKKAAKKTTKKKAVAKRGKDNPDQKHFKGMEPPAIGAVDRMLKRLRTVRRAREASKEQEETLLCSICDNMHKNKLSDYQGAGMTVVISPIGEQIKIKEAKK